MYICVVHVNLYIVGLHFYSMTFSSVIVYSVFLKFYMLSEKNLSLGTFELPSVESTCIRTESMIQNPSLRIEAS